LLIDRYFINIIAAGNLGCAFERAALSGHHSIFKIMFENQEFIGKVSAENLGWAFRRAASNDRESKMMFEDKEFMKTISAEDLGRAFEKTNPFSSRKNRRDYMKAIDKWIAKQNQ
jgi:hypothetical protein